VAALGDLPGAPLLLYPALALLRVEAGQVTLRDLRTLRHYRMGLVGAVRRDRELRMREGPPIFFLESLDRMYRLVLQQHEFMRGLYLRLDPARPRLVLQLELLLGIQLE
jgi:hypothetical protein